MRKDPPLLIAGLVFAIIALAHLARLWFQFPILVGDIQIPLVMNVIGFFVTGFLSLWMFLAVTTK